MEDCTTRKRTDSESQDDDDEEEDGEMRKKLGQKSTKHPNVTEVLCQFELIL